MNEHARIIGVIKGVASEITDANDAFLAMVGYSREEFESGGMDWRRMTPPEYQPLDDAGIRQAAESGGFTVPYQKMFQRRDGSRVPVLMVCAFIPDTPNAWMAYVVDLSAPAASSAVAADRATSFRQPVPADFYDRLVGELVRERARTVAMLDNTDAVLWAVDPALNLLSANQAFQDAQFRVSGQPLAVGDSVMSPFFPADVRAKWTEWYHRALTGEQFTVSTRHEFVEGTRIDEHRLSPMRNPDSEIVGVSVVSRNVSARAIAEGALRASEARFRTLTAASPMGIFLTDRTGAVEYSNPRLADIWQMATDAMCGAGLLERLLPTEATMFSDFLTSAVDNGERSELECDLQLDNGRARAVRIFLAPIRDGDSIAGCVGAVEDITERRAVAHRTRQREKMESLGTLAGGIAHDFNNMLSVVMGFADLALVEAEGQPSMQEHLAEIRTASVRARDLVRQILTFSRRADNQRQTVDLRATTAESVRLLRATLPAGVILDSFLLDEPLFVLADPTALQQVVMNLCTNAEHAMRTFGGGRLTVRLARVGTDHPGRAVLMISDTGEGMTAEVRDRIFEPFYTTKAAGEGTGMGLAVVHGIVSELGGTIAVDSVPGAGATFRVVLPLSDLSAAPSLVELPVRFGEGHVLLVEDEPALARFATKALERAGYHVSYCRNGTDALRLFAQRGNQFDLVISDISMPGLTGDRLLRELRRRKSNLPVILMTGYSEAISPEDARSAGAAALLQKPLSAAQLVAAVGDAITTRAPTVAESA